MSAMNVSHREGHSSDLPSKSTTFSSASLSDAAVRFPNAVIDLHLLCQHLLPSLQSFVVILCASLLALFDDNHRKQA